jgi:AcrR family transcriptional regulator
MPRTYTLKRRAERQADTRRRIVEAAIELHSSLGPARTPLSLVAERAGVQRHTLYAHFPDERSLLLACSGLTAERDPLPDAELWRTIADRRERLRAVLRAIYAWYGRNAARAACVLRDAEHHALTKEISEMRFGPAMRAWREVLGAGLDANRRAMLGLMLGFHAWRSLVRDSGLEPATAVELAIHAIECAEGAAQAGPGPLANRLPGRASDQSTAPTSSRKNSPNTSPGSAGA